MRARLPNPRQVSRVLTKHEPRCGPCLPDPVSVIPRQRPQPLGLVRILAIASFFSLAEPQQRCQQLAEFTAPIPVRHGSVLTPYAPASLITNSNITKRTHHLVLTMRLIMRARRLEKRGDKSGKRGTEWGT